MAGKESEVFLRKEPEPWSGRGVFLFPGQGAQKTGMGQELFDSSKAASAVFNAANEILGYSISEICFNNPDNALSRTEYAQPASGVVDIAAHAALLERYPQLMHEPPVISGGVSFGELPNLVVAGVIDLEQFLWIIKERGSIAEEAAEAYPGKMVAVLKMGRDEVEAIAKTEGVYPAIYYPGITVVSGGLEAMQNASKALQANGARVLDTGVEYAFHTPLMEGAKRKFADLIKKVKFNDPLFPVILNPTAEAANSGSVIKEYLPEGLTHPVDTVKMIQTAKDLGGSLFVELCPQPVLSSHLKRGNPDIEALSIYSQESLDSFKTYF